MTNAQNVQNEEQQFLEELEGALSADQTGSSDDGDEEIVEAGDDQGDEMVNEIVEPDIGEEEESQLSDEELEGLEDLDLDELDLDELELAEKSAETAEIDETEATEEALSALDAAIERQEAYQEQTSSSVVSNTTPSTPAQTATPAKARKASGPRVERDLSAIQPEFFVREGDPSTMDQAALDQAKADMVAQRPGQVKVAEKFDNLFISVAAGRTPSRYTATAFALLDKNTEVTSGDIVAAFKAESLGEGTARSQSGQMMVLFEATGIATRSGKVLKLNADSTIADRMRKIAA